MRASAAARKAPARRNGTARLPPVRPIPHHDCPGIESCAALQLVRDREAVAADAATAAVKALLDERLRQSDIKLETALVGIGRLQSEMGVVQRDTGELKQLVRQGMDALKQDQYELEGKFEVEREADRQMRADVLAEVRALRNHGRDQACVD